MNQQEFTDRTGYTPTSEDEWKAINTMYLEAGNMDKDVFCKEWKQHHKSDLLRIFYHRAMDNMEKLDYFNDMRNKTARLLITKSVELGDTDLYTEAVKLIGEKRAILFKIKNNLKLYGSDLEYITNNLQ